jgi:[acyl-carrier-protein] S-malonyltransferase
MKEACSGKDASMMALIGISDEMAEKVCAEERKSGKSIWCANYNSDGQIVLAGIKSDLIDAESKLKEAGAKKCVLLNMSVSSHCPLLEDARNKLDEYLNKFLKDTFLYPVISNATAKKYSSKSDAMKLLSRQLVSPVLYKQSILAIESEVDMFIEFGNGNVLKGLNKRITKKPTLNVSDIASLEKTLEQLQ